MFDVYGEVVAPGTAGAIEYGGIWCLFVKNVVAVGGEDVSLV
jgi:hypothetical protein